MSRIVPYWELALERADRGLQRVYGLNRFGYNDLQFLTRFGMCIALGYGVNSDTNIRDGHGSPERAKHCAVILDSSEVRAMRHQLHELANVFTGVVIAAGLLSRYLEGGSLRQYAADICEGSERGCSLVRELRSQLLAACGELEAGGDGSTGEAAPDDSNI